MIPAVPHPRGLRVEVTAPRWPLRLAMIGAGVLLLAMIAAAVFAVAFGGESTSGGSAMNSSVSTLTPTGSGYRASVRIELQGERSDVDLRHWTLLYDDGSLADGAVVQGPGIFAGPGVAELVVEFPSRGTAEPVWIRLHNQPGYLLSFPVTVGQP